MYFPLYIKTYYKKRPEVLTFEFLCIILHKLLRLGWVDIMDSSKKINVSIIGSTGYVGAELVRGFSAHPVFELKHLIGEVYPKIKDDLAEASAQGDRSDNAGYREARRNQAKTISRIRFLQKILEHSRVIDPGHLPKDEVCLLSRVEFTNLLTQTRMAFQVVSPHEMDLEAGKISLKSPIGAALMGKRVGEIAEAQVPSGTLRLRIESITLD